MADVASADFFVVSFHLTAFVQMEFLPRPTEGHVQMKLSVRVGVFSHNGTCGRPCSENRGCVKVLLMFPGTCIPPFFSFFFYFYF